MVYLVFFIDKIIVYVYLHVLSTHYLNLYVTVIITLS